MVAHPNTNEKVDLFKNGSQRGSRTSSIESSGGSRISMKRSIIAVADAALADLPNILARKVNQNLQRTPHNSHLTPHTSHLTPHTSHLTPHNLMSPSLFSAIPRPPPQLPFTPRDSSAQHALKLPRRHHVSRPVPVGFSCGGSGRCIAAAAV